MSHPKKRSQMQKGGPRRFETAAFIPTVYALQVFQARNPPAASLAFLHLND
jgi:hypothetical protein